MWYSFKINNPFKSSVNLATQLSNIWTFEYDKPNELQYMRWKETEWERQDPCYMWMYRLSAPIMDF